MECPECGIEGHDADVHDLFNDLKPGHEFTVTEVETMTRTITVDQLHDEARAGLARRTPALPTLTAAQVEDLYNDRISELDYAGHTLTRTDIDDAWLTIPIGPDDIDEDGCPASHMWQHLADAMTRWHGPQEDQ